ncbi:MAG: hypothetical protein NTZ80_01575 [Patescibacteria group bacterium]|nr:hypothetical protein [Patescibacteria group bacterium]
MPACIKCQSQFEITPDDLIFYDKISPIFNGKKFQIPSPTLCPECRLQRRMSWRNERNLFQRKCDITGAKIISMYTPDSPYKVCERDYWHSENFDAAEYGRDFDFNKPVFEQIHDLLLATPLPSLNVLRSENCKYNNDMSDCSNCYLCSRTHLCKDMLYTYRGNASNSCVDCYQAHESELLYECTECVKCYNSKYLHFCASCSESAFLAYCHDCMFCFMCTNLRQKQYCFFNEQLTKSTYEEKIRGFNLAHEADVINALSQFIKLKAKSIKQNLMLINAESSSGDNLIEVKDCFHCFGAKLSRECRYAWDIKNYSDSMDLYSGGRKGELIYEATATSASYNCRFCTNAKESSNLTYGILIYSSENLFGCVGLRNKKNCILNKQYTKEEYENLAFRIAEHMQRTGEWGEFFPQMISPFGYNHTVANEYFPMQKDEATKRGFTWSNYEVPFPKVERIIPAEKLHLLGDIGKVPKEILDWAIECRLSKKPFQITSSEIKFYIKQNIPLPSLHPNERHMARFKMLNPTRLRDGLCAKCRKAIQTTFLIGTENIYCEECYREAVY